MRSKPWSRLAVLAIPFALLALSSAPAAPGAAAAAPPASGGSPPASRIAAPAAARPGDPVTRAEFAVMLNEAFGYGPADEPARFPDVPAGHPAAGHLETARQIGYLRGNADGRAEPDRTVTRQEAAVMLDGLPGLARARLRMTIRLSDGAAVAGWARAAASRMAGSGILPADEEGRFRPHEPLTRAEAAAALEAAVRQAGAAGPLPRLRVSEDGRRLETEDGRPFFWLGDTAWELVSRLTREEAELYLADTAGHGFNVVQFVLITELGRQSEPNAYGDFPLTDKDPSRPAVTPGSDPDSSDQYDYWDHVDFVLDTAGAYGLYAAVLPAWGSYLWKNEGQRADPLFTPENAREFGKWLGGRYGNRTNIVWVLGGDRVPDTEDKREIIRSMARGLKEGGARQLITYHPWGGASSSAYFHREDWLDFNAFQSGHRERDGANYRLAEHDFALSPAKPTLDFEPRYEAHPIGFDPANGRFDGYDVRQAAYWSVFAGSFGHSYGHHHIWQMHAPGRAPSSHADGRWQDALGAPGRASMKWLRALFESYPTALARPAPDLVRGPRTGAERIAALRGDDAVLVYSSAGKPFAVRLDRLGGKVRRAFWYNPRTGVRTETGPVPGGTDRASFTPPSEGRGEDWVLIMDTSRSP